jgi:hypothetical protein
MNGVRQSSLDAFLYMQATNKLNVNQIIILDLFKKLGGHPLSNLDVANMLGWSINRVTPRVNELVKMGKLVHTGYKTQLETHRRVMLWCRPIDFKEFIDVSYTDAVDYIQT